MFDKSLIRPVFIFDLDGNLSKNNVRRKCLEMQLCHRFQVKEGNPQRLERQVLKCVILT